MKIEKIKISEVIPYWRNPRKNDKTIEALKESIKRYGFNVPIIVNMDNVIVSGHARYKAMLELGEEYIYAIRRDFSSEEEALFRIEDNVSADIAAWDFTKLEKEILGIGEESMEELVNIFEDDFLSGLSYRVFGGDEDAIVVEKKKNSEKGGKEKDECDMVECPFCGTLNELHT